MNFIVPAQLQGDIKGSDFSEFSAKQILQIGVSESLESAIDLFRLSRITSSSNKSGKE